MDNRPFYELDDDEILIEEAASAALSNAVTPLATESIIPPAVPLCAPLRTGQASVLVKRFERLPSMTMLDHAYLVNSLACTLDLEGNDRFGLTASIRAESGVILLDAARPGKHSRSETIAIPTEGLARLAQADLDYTARIPIGLSLRLERPELQSMTALGNAAGFFAFRQLTLALLPRLTKARELSDTIDEYTARARILFNSCAAKQAFTAWPELVRQAEPEAEVSARRVLAALQSHLKVLDT